MYLILNKYDIIFEANLITHIIFKKLLLRFFNVWRVDFYDTFDHSFIQIFVQI